MNKTIKLPVAKQDDNGIYINYGKVIVNTEQLSHIEQQEHKFHSFRMPQIVCRISMKNGEWFISNIDIETVYSLLHPETK